MSILQCLPMAREEGNGGYGPENALLMTAKRADALLELGDVEVQRVWKGIYVGGPSREAQ
jgi:hypothetical protein